jgi:hypothetical protein
MLWLLAETPPMTTSPIYPPPLSSVKRSRRWLWLSLANLALLVYGLCEARETFLAIFADFHAEITSLPGLALSVRPMVFVAIGLALAAWSVHVQMSGKSSARIKRFHVWMIILSNCVALLYAAAELMAPMSSLIDGMSK